MIVDLTGQKLDITDALRSYVNEKIEKIERHCDDISNIHVILSVEKLRHKAEANLSVTGNNLNANAVEENMYAAIDSLVDKLDRQIKKHNAKVKDHHQREGSPKKAIVQDIESADEDEE